MENPISNIVISPDKNIAISEIGGNINWASVESNGVKVPILSSSSMYGIKNPTEVRGGAMHMFPIAGSSSNLLKKNFKIGPIDKHGYIANSEMQIINDDPITVYAEIAPSESWPWKSYIESIYIVEGNTLHITDSFYFEGEENEMVPLLGGRHPEFVLPADEILEAEILDLDGSVIFQIRDAEIDQDGNEIEAPINQINMPKNGFILNLQSIRYTVKIKTIGFDLLKPKLGVWSDRFSLESMKTFATSRGLDEEYFSKLANNLAFVDVEPLYSGFDAENRTGEVTYVPTNTDISIKYAISADILNPAKVLKMLGKK